MTHEHPAAELILTFLERLAGLAGQLQTRAVGVAGRDEARVGWAQNEHVGLAVITLNTQTAALVFDHDDHALLDATAEVLDTRRRPNAWERSCRAKHHD